MCKSWQWHIAEICLSDNCTGWAEETFESRSLRGKRNHYRCQVLLRNTSLIVNRLPKGTLLPVKLSLDIYIEENDENDK